MRNVISFEIHGSDLRIGDFAESPEYKRAKEQVAVAIGDYLRRLDAEHRTELQRPWYPNADAKPIPAPPAPATFVPHYACQCGHPMNVHDSGAGACEAWAEGATCECRAWRPVAGLQPIQNGKPNGAAHG
jgi:hypothetical protein